MQKEDPRALDHSIFTIQCAARSIKETLSDHFGYPEKLLTLSGYVSFDSCTVIFRVNLNFSMSCSYTLSSEAGELMLLVTTSLQV